jgi:AraC-like DNA-binding protein
MVYDVHRLPRGIQSIHQDYGLWICHCGRGGCSRGVYPGFYRYFEYYSISHLHDGDGEFRIPEEPDQTMVPGDCIVIAPNFVHWYGCREEKYCEDAICFAGPLADALFKCGVLANGIQEMGRARRLLPIIELAADPAHDAQINANAALQKLLVDLYNENRHRERKEDRHPIGELLIELKKSTRKWWTVSEMAEFCNLSEAQFRRVFRDQTGILPKIYVDQLKIRQVAERLAHSKDSIARIAGEFGYVDPFHFSRRFKKLTGFSPTRYREEFF